jgi:hypothetical protein
MYLIFEMKPFQRDVFGSDLSLFVLGLSSDSLGTFIGETSLPRDLALSGGACHQLPSKVI